MASELQATFIVRLRRERGTPAGEWRGELEHVQSARRGRFTDQAALSAFVWSQLAETERQAGCVCGSTREVTDTTLFATADFDPGAITVEFSIGPAAGSFLPIAKEAGT